MRRMHAGPYGPSVGTAKSRTQNGADARASTVVHADSVRAAPSELAHCRIAGAGAVTYKLYTGTEMQVIYLHARSRAQKRRWIVDGGRWANPGTR